MSRLNPFELTRELMAIPSVTGAEGEVGRYLTEVLNERGYDVEAQEVSPERYNLLATRGPAEALYCTHIDTVPPVLDVREDDDALYGRGACDTKGIIAAMLEAGDRLIADSVAGFGYLFLVGEETGGDGAKAANTLDWDVRYTIVGEPTGNELARAQKGTLLVDLKVDGQAAHSGYPDAGRSAIHPLLDVLGDCLRTDWGEDPVLGRATLNVGVIEGGAKANILAPSAGASLMFRTVESAEQVTERLRQLVGERAAIEVLSGAAPEYMHVVEGYPQTVVSFGSDVPYLTNLGKRLLVGPGSILDAHTAGEKILKRDLVAGIALYDSLMRHLLAGD